LSVGVRDAESSVLDVVFYKMWIRVEKKSKFT